jgi:small subunit ribosomal protein S5
MTNEEIIKEEIVSADTPAVLPDASAAVVPAERARTRNDFSGRRDGGKKKGGSRPFRKGFERVKPEFDHKILNIRRVARVVAGGRRFSFSVVLVAGDRKGTVGVGMGKAGDTALAIEKAMRSAKKNMFKVSLNKKMSIPHDVKAKYSSGTVMLMPNKSRGLIAGSAVRIVADLGGIKDITGKVFSGSKNSLNIAMATIKALKMLKTVKTRGGVVVTEDKAVK